MLPGRLREEGEVGAAAGGVSRQPEWRIDWGLWGNKPCFHLGRLCRKGNLAQPVQLPRTTGTIVLVALVELSLTLPAAGGGRGLGQELGQVLMFSVKAGLALVLSCSLLCSAGIHEDSWDPSALTPGSGSSFSHARLLPWDLAEPPLGVWGQF